MAKSKTKDSARRRIGGVSVYMHHGNWWLYYRQNGRPVRRRAGQSEPRAEYFASLINAQLVADDAGLPSPKLPAVDDFSLAISTGTIRIFTLDLNLQS